MINLLTKREVSPSRRRRFTTAEKIKSCARPTPRDRNGGVPHCCGVRGCNRRTEELAQARDAGHSASRREARASRDAPDPVTKDRRPSAACVSRAQGTQRAPGALQKNIGAVGIRGERERTKP